MKFITYTRVSTNSQGESGLGIAAQEAACARVGVIASVYSDVASGATGLENRPALLQAIASLEKGDVLIVAKRDRLGRDPLVVAMIEASVARRGARIISAAGEGTESDSPSDVLMRRMVDAFSEYERKVIAARTKAALQAKKAKGGRVGSIPFGYKEVDGMLVECEKEQAAIRLIKLLKAGGESMRSICKELERQGFAPRGNSWHHQTITNILKQA